MKMISSAADRPTKCDPEQRKALKTRLLEIDNCRPDTKLLPAAVRRARRILTKWQRQERRLDRKFSKTVRKLKQDAENAILFATVDEALTAVARAEAKAKELM